MLKKILLNEYFIVSLIVLNAIILFADSFAAVQQAVPWLDKVDFIITGLFWGEMIYKIKDMGFKKYLQAPWNKLDFTVNLCLLPSLALMFLRQESLIFLTVLRLLRLGKFFRLFRFVPNIDHLLDGIKRALKASIFVFVAFFLYLFIISILSCAFFKGVSPEHFGNPLLSLYSTFKIFTIEGWFELPELIAAQYGAVAAFFVKMYFIFLVLTGGIFGISLVNAIFVDELVSDNNDAVLKKLEEIQKELEEIKNKK